MSATVPVNTKNQVPEGSVAEDKLLFVVRNEFPAYGEYLFLLESGI